MVASRLGPHQDAVCRSHCAARPRWGLPSGPHPVRLLVWLTVMCGFGGTVPVPAPVPDPALFLFLFLLLFLSPSPPPYPTPTLPVSFPFSSFFIFHFHHCLLLFFSLFSLSLSLSSFFPLFSLSCLNAGLGLGQDRIPLFYGGCGLARIPVRPLSRAPDPVPVPIPRPATPKFSNRFDSFHFISFRFILFSIFHCTTPPHFISSHSPFSRLIFLLSSKF